MKTLYLVAKREWLKIVTKPSFWASVILLPVFMVIVSVISGYSSASLEKKLTESIANATRVVVVDQSGVVDTGAFQPPVFVGDNAAAAIQEVRDGKADAAIVYPETLLQNPSITIAVQDEGVIGQFRYNDFAEQLVKQSVLSEIKGTEKQALLNASYAISTESYKNGAKEDYRVEKYVVPVVSIILYFLLSMMIGSYMLMSVSEEKENRIIETLLTTMSPKELIWGKIIGLTLVGFTQILALAAMAGAALPFALNFANITLDWGSLNINLWQIISALFFVVTGFLFMAGVMVGVGAAIPTYKEAQSFSSVFIILSIFPVYFASALIAEPSGRIAQITSFTPFTAPLVLLFRNAMNALQVWELLLGIVLMVVYVVVGFWLAFRLFSIGSLEYGRRISFRSLLGK